MNLLSNKIRETFGVVKAALAPSIPIEIFCSFINRKQTLILKEALVLLPFIGEFMNIGPEDYSDPAVEEREKDFAARMEKMSVIIEKMESDKRDAKEEMPFDVWEISCEKLVSLLEKYMEVCDGSLSKQSFKQEYNMEIVDDDEGGYDFTSSIEKFRSLTTFPIYGNNDNYSLSRVVDQRTGSEDLDLRRCKAALLLAEKIQETMGINMSSTINTISEHVNQLEVDNNHE